MPRTVIPGISLLAFILAAGWILLGLALSQGVNDAEYGYLVRTGLPSHPEKIHWSAWSKHGLDKIQLLVAGNLGYEGKFVEARYGDGLGTLVSFGFYQVRALTQNGGVEVLPAYGPNAWTRVNFGPPLILAVCGLLLFLLAMLVSHELRHGRANSPGDVHA